jgi:hypothetical protein
MNVLVKRFQKNMEKYHDSTPAEVLEAGPVQIAN